MIRIDTDQLDELIHKDGEIKKDLEFHLKDEKKMYDICYEKFLKQERKLFDIQAKRKQNEEKIKEMQQKENKLHSKINYLEIQKIFAERRLKRIFKQLAKCKTNEERQQYLRKYASVEEEIKDINKQQEKLRENLLENSKDIDDLYLEDFKDKETEEDIERDFARTKNNVAEWKLAIETKTNMFYQKTFDTMMTFYEPLRDLLVRNLQIDKAMTKDEAKKQTDGIIIEREEVILIDPPGYVKRLTKEKQKKYQRVQKM